MNVRITKLDPRAVIPEYKSSGAAAMDVTIIEEATIPPGGHAMLRTGLGFGLPERHAMYIFPRGSMFTKFHLFLTNHVGILDEDYCGQNDELFISVFNPTQEASSVPAGARIAQIIVIPIDRITLTEGPAGDINRGGFGSTGGHGV
ncbi:MAG: deoxyuridine 5'-triphosphate nucleotidohydrolase [Patescibacteria group bacterium]